MDENLEKNIMRQCLVRFSLVLAHLSCLNSFQFVILSTVPFLEFTKTLWLQDATQSLRNILAIEAAQQAFMAFLKTEYGKLWVDVSRFSFILVHV